MPTTDFSTPLISAVHTPQTSVTFQEFEDWRRSDSFPKRAKVSYIQGHLYIESDVSEPAIEVPHSGMTLDQFREWAYSEDFPQEGRITFIEGRLLIDMSPERIDAHNQVKSALNRVIDILVHQENLGTYYPDGAWITNESAKMSNEPDAMFASWETLAAGRLTPRKRRPEDEDSIELSGTPDWVCEIISNTSEKVDKNELTQTYHKAGIREYWLIDARGNEVILEILVWTPSSYLAVEPRDGWRASPVFGREFQLTRTRNPVGQWDYELGQRTP
jgi:Uma2 family endonuclease